MYESNLLRPEKPGLSLQGANLERANLRGANLVDVDLRNASKGQLGRCQPAWGNLSKANLRGANLKQADLSGAFLQEMTEEGSLKRRSMRQSETMLQAPRPPPAPRALEAVWEEELEGS